jgi:two-component system, chemotaxis family, chemotaxis protein CheY
MAGVLLIDDDSGVRQACAEALRGAGLEVNEATDGVEAFRLLSLVKERPCFVVLDLHMPRMDGLEFLEQLKMHPSAGDVRVLLVSGDPNVRAAEHFPGVVGVLAKPIQMKDLLASVNGSR